MFGGNDVADKALLKMVQRRLERTGSQSRLTATVQRGAVTLTGKLQYEKLRMTIVNAIKGVSGVRQVIDRLQSPPKVKHQPTQYVSVRASDRQPEAAPEKCDQKRDVVEASPMIIVGAPEECSAKAPPAGTE